MLKIILLTFKCLDILTVHMLAYVIKEVLKNKQYICITTLVHWVLGLKPIVTILQIIKFDNTFLTKIIC